MTTQLLKCLWMYVLLGLPVMLYAQKAPEKFGKIDIQDITTKVCPIDSNAQAYYIFDFGLLTFEYANTKISLTGSGNSNKGFRMVFERHFRIKILDNAAADVANIEIPLYKEGEAEEELSEIKANTYNDLNNSVETVKLEKSKIIKEQETDSRTVMKFPMPKVKAGSVIEVSYKVISDFLYNLQGWSFQYEIPVLKSEYHVRIPEYFRYNQHQKGYIKVNNKESTRAESITLEYYDQVNGYVLQQRAGTQTLRYQEQVYQYTAENVPAFVVEKYLRSPKSYISAVVFELQTIQFPGSIQHNYATDWESIRNKLLEHEKFGAELKKTGFLKEEVTALKQLNLTGAELVRATQTLLKSKMKWNESNGLYVTKPLRDAYKSGSGTTTEINLCLVILLRELGFEVFPLILSTQANGLINRTHPTISDFNCTVAIVTFEGKKVLVDASDPFSDINLLPIRCVNDYGLIITPLETQWIDLERIGSYKGQSVYNLELNPSDLSFTGTLDYNTGEYASYFRRKKLGNFATQAKQVEQLQSQYEGLQIKNAEITNFNNPSEKLKEHYEVNIKNYSEAAGDLVYFSPLFYETYTENPFKLVRRDYPVFFDYPALIAQTVAIQIPEDFAIDATPQSLLLSLYDKSAKFSYNITVNENTIQISSQLNINKTLFLPEEYADLKEFYGQVIAKQNEKIVLKKK